jgi:transcriptional regulator with XRE-family HTH domain
VLSFVLESPGDLLRAWRLEQGLTQADVASLLYVSTAAVSGWETGVRGIPRDALQALDEEYDAAGCLVDMVRAIGTPQGYQVLTEGRLEPRPHRYWPHVFTDTPGPVWVWIRPAATGSVDGLMHAGPNRLRIAPGDPAPGGLFVTFGEWDPLWAIQVALDASGWVDFGRGELPAWVEKEVRVLRGESNLELVGRDPREMDYLVGKVRELDRGDPDALPDRMRELVGDELWARHAPHWGEGVGPPGVQLRDIDDGPRSQVASTGQRDLHRRLRQARGFSRSEVAATITGLLQRSAERVSDDQIYNYESGRRSRVRHLGALLDVVYDGGGWTCFEPIPVHRILPGRFTVEFPSWWIGPVSVRVGQATSATTSTDPDVGSVRLESNRWQNERMLGPQRQAFTFLRVVRDGPLHVSVPPGRGVRAFLGHDPLAVFINRGWVPTGPHSDERLPAYREALLTLIGKTAGDLERALGRAQGEI